MIKRQVILLPEHEKLIRTLPPDLKQKVRSAFDEILRDPAAGKALVEDLAGLRSFRIGRFRIIYRVLELSIEIVTLGPRASVYKKALFEFRRQ